MVPRGAGPEEVEKEIVIPQEDKLKALAGLVEMESESHDSMGNITLTFQIGTDMEAALLKVSNKLDQVPRYPERAEKPVIVSAGEQRQAIAYVVLGRMKSDPVPIDREYLVHRNLELRQVYDSTEYIYASIRRVRQNIFLGGGLAVLGLWLVNTYVADQPMDILTMPGFVILVGIVVNNAILIVHQSLNFIREQGMDPKTAIVEAVRIRVRPIYMSTTTSIFGMVPLVLYPGAGSELYRGLGSVVIGGLALSTVFTLFLIPALLSMVYAVGSAAGRVSHLNRGRDHETV